MSTVCSISTVLGATFIIGLFLICIDMIATIAWRCFVARKPNVCLKGKHVLITGGSKGIGKEVAKEFVKRGANVSILARNAQQLSEATNEISQLILTTTNHSFSTATDRQKIQDISVDITSDFETVAKSVR